MKNHFPKPPEIMRVILLAVFTTVFNLYSFSQPGSSVQVSSLFADHMVLQRGKAVPVFGTAPENTIVSVSFNGQTVSDTSDANNNWKVWLEPMDANTFGQTMTIQGKNTLTVNDILIGDVWLCSGQSNMDWRLSGCERPEDISTADFPGIRQFTVPIMSSGNPLTSVSGNWMVCSPETAGGFTAVGFYYARKIYLEQEENVPIGLILSSVGGTTIDLWLSPEGTSDIPELSPLYNQGIVPSGPFSLFNGMIHPLAPYGIKGAIWYQGENAELTKQTKDSYFLKLKALTQGWKRLWGMDDFPFNLVMIANWGTIENTFVPDTIGGKGWDSDTRIQQLNAMALPHTGVASAIDIGDIYSNPDVWKAWHPANKLDVGDRLALWPLKYDFGMEQIVESGPVLKEVSASGSTLVCSFDYIGSGLMVGKKDWYVTTQDVTETSSLKSFVISDETGNWYEADAIISDDHVVLSSASVAEPHGIGYACWQNPLGANLYNKEGLPAAPFYIGNVHEKYVIESTAGAGGAINPAGTKSVLPRTTSLYKIIPEDGFYIEDVKVDGVSVGSVRYYTFDPVYDNHNIVASFSNTAPEYRITVTKNSGGLVLPAGDVITVKQGGNVEFNVYPDTTINYSISVDDAPLGERLTYTFADVRKDHNITIDFSCQIRSMSGFGGNIQPSGDVNVKTGSDQAFTITPLPGFSISEVIVDGESLGNQSTYTFNSIAEAHSILATFTPTATGTGRIPLENELVFACLSDSLPKANTSGSWPAWFPEGKKFAKINSPVVEVIDRNKFSKNSSLNGDGYNVGTYTSGIQCNGASIIAVVKPSSYGSADVNWHSVVDVFYDRLVLGVMNSSGKVVVRRNGSLDYSSATIPDGQTTVLSLIVQPDGKYKVFANGSEIMSKSTVNQFSSIIPGTFKTITIGRNGPDNWTTFNGSIGDVFLYKAALPENDRIQLETYIFNRLSNVGDQEPPTPPTNLIGEGASSSSIVLRWEASNDNVAVTGYNIYNNGIFIGTTTELAFTVTELNGGTEYSFTVKAIDGAGNISASSEKCLASTLPVNVLITQNEIKTIYPNPVTSELTIKSKDDEITVLSIYDLLGNILHTENFSGKIVIERKVFGSQGIYIIGLKNSTQTSTAKVVVR
jgi:sialate O-acetylesterase